MDAFVGALYRGADVCVTSQDMGQGRHSECVLTVRGKVCKARLQSPLETVLFNPVTL